VRLILDTNVFVSGVFFAGPPLRILDAWRDGRIELLASPEILEEYAEVGDRLRARYPGVDLTPVLAMVVRKATLVHAPPLGKQVCADPDDDKFLACALAGRCRRILSGDKHLLEVSGFRRIKVLRPREFVDAHLRA